VGCHKHSGLRGAKKSERCRDTRGGAGKEKQGWDTLLVAAFVPPSESGVRNQKRW